MTVLCAPLAAFGAETAPAQPPADPKPVAKLECLKPADARDELKERHFLEPFVVLRSAAREVKAEALSAKLCHFGDDWVYSIALLHRDGRYVHILMDAVTGRILPARARETPKP